MKKLNKVMMVLAATLITAPALAKYEMMGSNLAVTTSLSNVNHHMTISRVKGIPINVVSIRMKDVFCASAPAGDMMHTMNYKVNGKTITTVHACSGFGDRAVMIPEMKDMEHVTSSFMKARSTVKFMHTSGEFSMMEFSAKGFTKAYNTVLLNN